MGRFWMVRAGTAGHMAGRFERLGFVGIQAEWPAGLRGPDDVRTWVRGGVDLPPGRRQGWPSPEDGASKLLFIQISVGDDVVTFDPSRDEYIVGKITGHPEPSRGRIPGCTVLRSVEWEGRVSQTLLGREARAALGKPEVIFEAKAEALSELRRILAGPFAHEPWSAAAKALEEVREKLATSRQSANNAVRLRVVGLDSARLRTLTVGLLGAMGFRIRPGKATGVGDAILASPHGFGLGSPRVVVAVRAGKDLADKACVAAMTAMVHGGTNGTSGMIICPAGFDDEARRMAGRAATEVVLVDAEEFTALVVEHYQEMSPESRAALPLSVIYLPVF